MKKLIIDHARKLAVIILALSFLITVKGTALAHTLEAAGAAGFGTPQQAIDDAVSKHKLSGHSYYYQIDQVERLGDWAYGAAARVDRKSQQVIPSGGFFILAHRGADGNWTARLFEDGASYNDWLDQIPEDLIDNVVKDMVRNRAVFSAAATVSASGYYLPWPAGIGARVTQNYSAHTLGQIDFVPDVTELRAAKSGTIVYVNDSNPDGIPGFDSKHARYNNSVVIQHTDTEYTIYLHIKQNSVPAKIKQACPTGNQGDKCFIWVDQGEKIAEMGDSGLSTGPHLHLSTASSYFTYYADDYLDLDNDGDYAERVYSVWTSNHTAIDFVEYSYAQLENWPYGESSKIFSQNPSPVGGNRVELYNGTNYQAGVMWSSAELGLTTSPGFKSGSIKIPAGWSVKVWEHNDLTGKKACFTSSVPNTQAVGWGGTKIEAFRLYKANKCPRVNLLDNLGNRVWFSTQLGFFTSPSHIAKSIKIAPGWSVIIWDADNKSGAHACLSATVNDTGTIGWDAKTIQALEIFDYDVCVPPPAGDQIKLFSAAGYGGTLIWQSGTTGVDTLPSAVARSIEIPSGWSLNVWDTDDRSVGTQCFSTSQSDITMAIEAVEVFSVDACKAEPLPESRVELYSAAGYTGMLRWSTADLGLSSGISHTAASIKIPAGWSVEIWDTNDKSGVYSCFSGSVTDLPATGWGSRRVETISINNTDVCVPPPVCPTPGPVSLIKPANGSTTRDHSPLMDWSAASNADWFQIQVSTSLAFSPVKANFHLQSAYWVPPWDFPQGTYYWRVRGENWNGGCDKDGAWSPVYSFTLIPASWIFYDDFESGSLNQWSKHIGTIQTSPAATLAGSNGVQVDISDLLLKQLVDFSPQAEKEYHARFYIDINDLLMSDGSMFKLFQGKKGRKRVFFLLLRKYQGDYWMRGAVRLDNGSLKRTNWYILPNQPSYVEVKWRAASSPTKTNGQFRLFINGALQQKLLGLDNDTFDIRSVKLGVTAKIKSAFN
ncbi:MAG: M23 family metallopeptidase, partial [Anaerolineae bacterium]|nr:M23 family metallopeptidase [Anaerolineae bacterium]